MTLVRPETEADIAAIYAVNFAAFGGPTEADLVDRLRADADLVLSLVAIVEGRIVGHIAFSRLKVATAAGEFAAVSLAPLAVHPDFQRRGVGGALIEAAHDRLRAAGESLSLVLGDPAYYSRFGYRRDGASGLESEYQGDAFMARTFARAPTSGLVRYPAAFRELA